MKLLAVDTATEACSAALLIGDSLLERYEVAPRAHARLLLPMLDSLLAEAGVKLTDLDAIAFGRGPGSFTGVRIAASVVQGLAFGADLPVLPVSTLAALARAALQTTDATHVLAAIDARMEEIYWASYQRDARGEPKALSEEQVTAAQDLVIAGDADWYGIGTGWAAYESVMRPQFGTRLLGCDAQALPRAAHIAQLAALDFDEGRALPAELALPVYIRNQVAKRPGAAQK
ncbi:MAG: tRNA (adenosine(37)-N6)-threonylcarbamoyltransferase complex dimerization subunit type 1 TsaB [Gammaproteobacteria bacterium]|nr:tRNA (adenosine(37)-N6)-threonylcarbamoyltransferase complex dimerization subunit type 1 TsaB [Gammaproteobacteria bacterium]MBU2479262.1 tRNA (adenosine(37)-N6)-threonylcarbamoyltransferase complex dimerization subunit type 1 TsaB [Gammaproteobacteria bacterium]